MPWLENLNILSFWWFIFFLLIFLIGYIFVEILLWKKYFFRKNLEKYENHLFDRIIHYIAWWIVLNVLYIVLLYFFDKYQNIADLLISSWKMWEIFQELWYAKNIQFIVFSIFYFFNFIIVLSFLTKFDKIIQFFVLVFDFFKKKSKRKK
jgi:hypothetical protein